MSTEVEAKLSVPAGFELPPLDDALPGLVAEPAPVVSMEVVYLDAVDLRLVRAGISLRHRTGEGGPEGTWTLKLTPAGGLDDGVLRRVEIVVGGPQGEPPPELAARVRPWLRTSTLEAVAHLRTRRRRTRLLLDGRPVGEVDDDEVSVVRDGDVVDRFREVEVESDDDDVLAAVVARLQDAGAGAPDPTPKVARALGPRALDPPDLVVADVDGGDDTTAGDVLRAAIAASVARIVLHDAVIRDGTDPEGVHQARVGCRRLRSDLRTYGDLVEAAWAGPLRDEVKWLADELGAARDLDVLAARLRADAEHLPETERPSAAAVLDRLDAERRAASVRAVEAIDGDRYLALLDRLVDAARAPVTTPLADRPATEVVPTLAGKAHRKLRKAARRVGAKAADSELHELRINAKRARYAADVAAAVAGEPARRYADAVAALQDVLGDHHDRVVAEAWLADVARGADTAPGEAFALGRLAALQRREADRLRRRWRRAWKAVDRSKRTSWMPR